MDAVLLNFLENVDGALTSSVAATLTGMTLTAASLLANLVKTQGDRVALLDERVQAAEDSADQDPNPSHAAKAMTVVRHADDRLHRAIDVAQGVTRAFHALLIGFGAFCVTLIESLVIDPNIEKSIRLANAASLADATMTLETYTRWLVVDVTLSAGSLAVGLAALCYGAIHIARLAPKP
jgi:hypothetical protein